MYVYARTYTTAWVGDVAGWLLRQKEGATEASSAATPTTPRNTDRVGAIDRKTAFQTFI
jgi:hypothetical protein